MSSARLAVSVVATLASAASFGLASALQHAESGQVDRRGALDPGLLGALARRPLWLVGVAADVFAVVLQAVALRFGPVSLVQPLLIAGLPAAVLLACLLARRPPHRAELVGIGLCSLGLIAIAPATSAAEVQVASGWTEAVVAGVLLTVLTLALLLLARQRLALAGVATGAAAGVLTGAGSVLLAVCAVRADDPVRLLLTVTPYVTVVVGLLGLLVSQAAFQTGTIGAPLATLSIVEPVVAVVLAVTVLHQPLSASTVEAALALAGAVAAAAGIFILARSQDAFSATAVLPASGVAGG